MQREMEDSDIKKDLSDVKNSAKKASEEAFSALSEGNVKKLASQLVDELNEFLEDKKEEVAGVRNKCRHHIKENPFLTVAGSLAVGALLGIILKR